MRSGGYAEVTASGSSKVREMRRGGCAARAWGLATAYILSNSATQNVSVGTLNSTYGPLLSSVRCKRCKDLLQAQITSEVQSWSMVQSTI